MGGIIFMIYVYLEIRLRIYLVPYLKLRAINSVKWRRNGESIIGIRVENYRNKAFEEQSGYFG